MAKMKTPKKKDVIKYFENAKEIESEMGAKVVIGKDTFKFLKQVKGLCSNWIHNGEYVFWSSDFGYAKILSYKEPKEKTYKITKEQIKQLKHNAFHENNQLVVSDLNNWFPEVFESKLEAGKWYKSCGKNISKLFRFNGEFDESKFPKGYGFISNGNFVETNNIGWGGEFTEATKQEVTEALTKEAVSRGFKNGNYNCLFLPNLTHKVVENFHYRKEDDTLYQGENPDSKNNAVYFKGQWAEIIPTLTKQEAEAKLNCKIV